jgi:hypothetical protein
MAGWGAVPLCGSRNRDHLTPPPPLPPSQEPYPERPIPGGFFEGGLRNKIAK